MRMRLITLNRLTISYDSEFIIGYFDDKILDVKGFSFGFIDIGWWYDDILEGLK